MGPLDVDDPFAADQRRQKARLLTGAVTVALVIAGIFAILWWRDPERALAKARPALDQLRAQYCKVYEVEKAHPAAAPSRAAAGAEPVRGLPYYFLDMKVYDFDEHPDANADTIEMGDLEAMCNGDPRYGKGEFSSQLGKLLAPTRNGDVKLDSMKKLLGAMQRVRYLFVARVSAYTASVATGSSGLLPGRYAGTAAIYKLEDASLVAAAAVAENAPGFALVSGRQDGYGRIDQTDLQGGLGAQTSLAFDEAFERAFKANGLAFKVR